MRAAMLKGKESIQRVRTLLLKALQDGEFHSGERLAKTFELSRSAISNHVKALCELGVEIFSVKGRGYKLANPIELLSHAQISQHLFASSKDKASQIQVQNLVTSTNDIIKAHLHSAESGFCCLAEAQSAGRGRRGRTWVSPYASSLYFSMLWRFSSGYQAMAGLSLMVGVIVNETLLEIGVGQCQLKWPNDIYVNNQKLAGILIEVEGQVGASASAIIGIGVNIRLPSNVKGIDQAFTDLHRISEHFIGRNKFAAVLIQNLWQALPLFEKEGMKPFISRWQKADLYKNKEIKLLSGESVTVGVSRGIDETGALLLEIDGKVQAFHGGEISVRPA
jgi:BirA family biotin operon repressor/biotin-[acetyl-CoA-carboxylase] ligase